MTVSLTIPILMSDYASSTVYFSSGFTSHVTYTEMRAEQKGCHDKWPIENVTRSQMKQEERAENGCSLSSPMLTCSTFLKSCVAIPFPR